MKFGLKSNMLLGFVSAAVAVIFAIGMVVTWKLNESTSENAALITDVVRANANERVRGHLKIFERYLALTGEKIETQATIINSQAGVAQFLQNDHLPPLKKHLSSAAKLGQLSFGIFFDLEGNQSATFPENDAEISLDGQFGILRSDGNLRARLTAKDVASWGALSSVMRLDGGFLQNFDLSDMIGEGEGALAAVSAVAVRDEFGDPVGFLVLGKVLNGYTELLEQLNAITNSAFAIYVDGKSISSAGFAAMAPEMDTDSEAAIAGSTDGQIVALDADGKKYIAFCTPIGLESGVNGACLCAGVPEAGVVSAQNDMVSYGTATSNAVQLSILIIGIISLAVFVALSFFMANRIVGPLVKMAGVTGRLAGGDMEVVVPGGDRNDEIGEMARSLEQIRTVGVMAVRAQSSLDDASSPMMIVDPDGTVIFPNKAMATLAEELSTDLGSELRGFADGVLTGAAFDTLHNVEPMQAGHLMTLDKPASARMVAGGRTIDLTASPVFNAAGDRLGAVVEWADMTGQVAVEREIAGIVHAAGQGDFSQRLNDADKSGFMADLSNGMNELLNVMDSGLNQVVSVMSALAEGDLTKRMEGDYKGAFARLKQDANTMAGQIESIAGRISSVTGAVRGATREIAAGISDLSARTEHQASSLEETTASMEELSTTVRQNAENAQEANQVSEAARDAANSGSDVADKAVSAMSGIEDSSRQITDIVGLIQEIAFQTNLLALNASVEAARAGDAGRGFAVVANEVRALAQRAATASKEIKELIVNSDNQVKAGVELVNQAGSGLTDIVASVKKVADFVSEIAAASQEQSAGIDQVSNAITNMDEMTQQNASLVEETTAALNSAQTQVEDLRQAVGFFKTVETANQNQQAEPREADADDLPAANPVAEQQRSLARKVAASGRVATAAAVEVDEEWQEF